MQKDPQTRTVTCNGACRGWACKLLRALNYSQPQGRVQVGRHLVGKAEAEAGEKSGEDGWHRELSQRHACAIASSLAERDVPLDRL